MPAEELDTDYYENLVKNRLWIVPKELIIAVDRAVVVEQTDQYGFTTTAGGIVLAEQGTFEKKYNLCEVLAVGENVPKDKCDVGDIAVIQRSTAFRCPDGMNAPHVWRVEYSSMHVIYVLPNLVAERLSAKFRKGGSHEPLTLTEMYVSYAKEYAAGNFISPVRRK